MGRHWMLLTQVSGPHVIACFIIRRGGGVQFLTIIFIFCCRGQLVTEMTGVLLKKFKVKQLSLLEDLRVCSVSCYYGGLFLIEHTA